MIKVSSLMIMTTVTMYAVLYVKASSTSSASSAITVRGGNDGSDVLHHKKKRRRRRGGNSGESLGTLSFSDLTPKDANASDVPDHDEEPVVKQELSASKKSNAASTTRKRKKRRRKSKENDVTDQTYDDHVLLPLPDDEPVNGEPDDLLQPEISEVSAEEGTYSSQTESTPILHEDSDSLPSKHSYVDKEEEIVSNSIESEDSTQQTKTEICLDGPTPTITTTQVSSRESEKRELAESNDGQTVTFTHSRRQRSVQITTKSRLAESSAKIKTASNKLAKESKSQTTGKGGECLRRIKREWKDAVQMGIAYDWTQMKTIKKKESSSTQNNYVRLGPFGKNLLRWHFSVMGPANSVYQDGIYHGRVLLPKDYPGSPPRVQMLTPSGCFVCGEDICLSASNYHPETWSPRWTVLSLVDALRLHMLTQANEIGGVTSTDEKRRSYAESSRSWFLPGVADHRQMVADGMFLLDDDEMETIQVDPTDNTQTTTPKVHDELNENVQKTKVAKSNEEIPAPNGSTTDKTGSKTKRSKSNKINPKAAKKAPHVDVQNAIDNVERTLTKRLVIEMLKLPLRMLSIVLMLLTLMESKLRSILDSI